MALQAGKMILPAFILATNKLGECELMNDIGEKAYPSASGPTKYGDKRRFDR